MRIGSNPLLNETVSGVWYNGTRIKILSVACQCDSLGGEKSSVHCSHRAVRDSTETSTTPTRRDEKQIRQHSHSQRAKDAMWQAAIIPTAAIRHHFAPHEHSLCSNANEPCFRLYPLKVRIIQASILESIHLIPILYMTV